MLSFSTKKSLLYKGFLAQHPQIHPRPTHTSFDQMRYEKTKQMIEDMIKDINDDITKMYDELIPLDPNVDIDMVCFMDPETNMIVCK